MNSIFDQIDHQPSLLRQDYCLRLDQIFRLSKNNYLDNIVLAGMGGSALAAELFKNIYIDKLSVPFEIIRDYNLPSYVESNTLVIISSYSGNTEETISCFHQAMKKQAKIVIATSGGKLYSLADKLKLPLIDLPSGLQPRLGYFATFKGLIKLLSYIELIADKNIIGEIDFLADWLDIIKSNWNKDKLNNNQAIDLATDLSNHPIAIYSGPMMRFAALKWKINFNENSKQLAFYNTFPEFNHNEFNGWIFPKNKNFKTIYIESSLESKINKKRMNISEDILSEHGFNPITIETMGRNLMQHIFSTVLFGDYISAYLGEINNINPLTVPLVEDLKRGLV